MATGNEGRLGTAPDDSVKAPCVAATTADTTLSGEQTIDSVSIVAGDRVLVINQTDLTENGVYVASTSAWSRATDFNAADDIVNGVLTLDAHQSVLYQAVVSGAWTPGTAPMSFTPYSGNGQITFLNKAAAVLLSPVANTTLYILSSDGRGNIWRAVTGAAAATYSDDGGSYCGTVFIPTGGDGSSCWERDYDGGMYSHWFGTVGDGVTDNASYFQAAIDSAISNNKKLIIKAGEYLISFPLLVAVWSGTAFSFFSLDIDGERSVWSGHDGGDINGVRIVPDYDDKPAIIIQSARSVVMKDVAVKGLNDVWSLLTPADGYKEMLDNSTFTTVGRDSQYSPFAGICIDPFGTAIPSDGGYPGMSTYYSAGAAGSSGVFFERVVSQSFIVAFMVTPNQTTQNAENIIFTDCRGKYSKVGLAIGQSQSRTVEWRGGNLAFNLFGIDCVNYGVGQGASPNVFGCNMSGKYLFNVHLRFGSPFNVYGIHAESFGSIGFLGGNASDSEPANFHGCSFNFGLAVDVPMVDFHLYSANTVNFNGCLLNDGSGILSYPLRFHVMNGCNFTGGQIKDMEKEFWLASTDGSSPAADRFNFRGLVFPDDGGRGTDACILDTHNVVVNSTVLNHQVTPIGAKWHFNTSAEKGNMYFNGDSMPLILISASVTVTSAGDGTASFTAPDVTIVREGDLMYTLTSKSYEGSDLTASINSSFQCVGIVTGIAGSVVTISGWPQSLATGTYHIRSSWWRRGHQATTGDTNTSTSITNVDQPAAWKEGQKIMGSGITEGTYIETISGTTFTLSKATSSTLVGTRLYDADMYLLTGAAV